jgi:hypothetical protein
MIKFSDLSFPPRVLALIIGIVLIGLTLYLTYVYVYGSVTVDSPQPNAYASTEKDPAPLPLPHTFRLKPGKPRIDITAAGYIKRSQKITIYPFWHRKVSVTLAPDYSFETPHFKITWQDLEQSYLIVPVIDIPPQTSPESEVAAQWTTYSKFADEALGYIKQQGGDPKSLPIEWWGQEWWPKGKSIPIN